MTKHILIGILFAVCLAGSMSAQFADGDLTGGNINCRFWNKATVDWRAGFIMGYADGASYVASRHKDELEPWPAQSTYGEVLKGLNEVCQAPQNARLPLTEALIMFKMKVEGSSAEQIEEYAARIRRIIAAAQK